VEPYFQMLWAPDVPRPVERDAEGRATELAIVAGSFGSIAPPPPPPNSWAASADSDLAIWTLRMEPDAEWTLPAAGPAAARTLYYFRGSGLRIGERSLPASSAASLVPGRALALRNGPEPAELLLLQGRPIGEPVVQYGPFVMNSAEEIEETFEDFRRTGFGGWPWPSDDPVHSRDTGRFAKRPDGEVEKPRA
jgi:redox-sensitive bicupin YhaK (pirin superfamily)